MKKLPKTIYVCVEENGEEEPYLMVYEDLRDCADNGKVIGVYELSDTGKMKVSFELV